MLFKLTTQANCEIFSFQTCVCVCVREKALQAKIQGHHLLVLRELQLSKPCEEVRTPMASTQKSH